MLCCKTFHLILYYIKFYFWNTKTLFWFFLKYIFSILWIILKFPKFIGCDSKWLYAGSNCQWRVSSYQAQKRYSQNWAPAIYTPFTFVFPLLKILLFPLHTPLSCLLYVLSCFHSLSLVKMILIPWRLIKINFVCIQLN